MVQSQFTMKSNLLGVFAHRGQYHNGKEKGPSLVLEAICDGDTFIWYHFFGTPGTCNDINILDRSTIIGAMLEGKFDLLTDPYFINGVERDWLYFLVDGIYPDWAIFVNTIKGDAAHEEERKFASKQESVRKDIERAFGILVKQWQILDRTFRQWDKDEIAKILDCCIIMHNMVVEHRRRDYTVSEWMYTVGQSHVDAYNSPLVSLFDHSPANNNVHGFGPARAMTTKCTDTTKHIILNNDLLYKDVEQSNARGARAILVTASS